MKNHLISGASFLQNMRTIHGEQFSRKICWRATVEYMFCYICIDKYIYIFIYMFYSRIYVLYLYMQTINFLRFKFWERIRHLYVSITHLLDHTYTSTSRLFLLLTLSPFLLVDKRVRDNHHLHHQGRSPLNVHSRKTSISGKPHSVRLTSI